jgi:hypothetical protein
MRDRQFEPREPLANQRKIQRQVSMKYKQHKKNRNIISGIWDPISYKWKGLVVGSGFGMMTYFIANPLFSNKVSILIAAFFVPVLMFIGIFFGIGFTWLEDLRDS